MAKTYETLISVLDRFSTPILAMEDKLSRLGNVGAATQKKLMMSPSEKLWGQLSSDVEGARSKFGELGESIGNIGGRLADVLPMLGALGAGASVAGLLEMTHAASEAVEALRNMSLITGVAVPQLQSLDFASQQSGISADLLGRGLEKLNINLGKAAGGQNKPALALFHAMGIDIRDANGHVKNLTQILPQLEASFQKTQDPALRAAMAMTLFGKSGEELLPFLVQGPGAIEDLQKKFEEFGYSFSGQDLTGMKQFQDAWNDAQLSVHGLTDEISAKLAPVLAPLLEDFATFVAQNRDLVATDLAGAIQKIEQELNKIQWAKDTADVSEFARVINKVVDHDHLGGWEGIIAAVGVAMALDFLSPVISLTAAIGKAAIAVGAFGVDALLPLGANLIKVVPEIKSFSEVMTALDIIMDANPIGVAVTAAGALAAVGLEVYDNWKPIEGFFDKVGAELDVFATKAAALDKILGFSNDPGETDDGSQGGRFHPARSQPLLNEPAGGAPLPKLLPLPNPAGGNGKIDFNVKFQNAPPGTVVAAATSGIISKPNIKGLNGTVENHR